MPRFIRTTVIIFIIIIIIIIIIMFKDGFLSVIKMAGSEHSPDYQTKVSFWGVVCQAKNRRLEVTSVLVRLIVYKILGILSLIAF